MSVGTSVCLFTSLQRFSSARTISIDWYMLLLEENCTIEVGESDRWDNKEYIKCRVERASPDADWPLVWRLARYGGLGPDNISFLFRMIHQTLPTQERVSRTKPGTSPQCKLQECSAVTEDLSHALLHCPGNESVGLNLLTCLREIQPGLQADALLRLEIQVEEELELPVVWTAATILRIVWNMRQTSPRIRPYLVRSQLEAEINLLRGTRYSEATNKITELAEVIFS